MTLNTTTRRMKQEVLDFHHSISKGGAKRGNFVGEGTTTKQDPTPANHTPYGCHPHTEELATEFVGEGTSVL